MELPWRFCRTSDTCFLGGSHCQRKRWRLTAISVSSRAFFSFCARTLSVARWFSFKLLKVAVFLVLSDRKSGDDGHTMTTKTTTTRISCRNSPRRQLVHDFSINHWNSIRPPSLTSTSPWQQVSPYLFPILEYRRLYSPLPPPRPF